MQCQIPQKQLTNNLKRVETRVVPCSLGRPHLYIRYSFLGRARGYRRVIRIHISKKIRQHNDQAKSQLFLVYLTLHGTYNIRPLSENIKSVCTRCEKTEKLAKRSLFYLFLKLVQIICIFSDNDNVHVRIYIISIYNINLLFLYEH
jgi:hypothetical protein